MNSIIFMVHVLIGAKLSLPSIGVLVCRTINGVPRWIKPKRQRKG